MKNIFKYTVLLFLGTVLLASCQENEDFQKTVDAPKNVAYVDANSTVTATLTHSPVGSFLDLGESIYVKVNTSLAAGTKVRFAADNSLVEAYNEEHTTTYSTIPDGYVKFDKDIVVAKGSTSSEISYQIYLEGNLSSLTEAGGYLIPLRMESASGAAPSKDNNTVYIIVNVEYSNIRPLSSVADVIATTVANRSAWSSDLTDANNMFDGDATTHTTVAANPDTFTVDLGTAQTVDGLRMMVYSSSYVPNVQIEYGTTGSSFEDAGTATNAKYVTQSDESGRLYQYIMFYGPIQARYLRITTSNWNNATYRMVYEFDVMKTDTSAGVIYAGTTEFSGRIYHTPGGSTTDLAPEFDIRTLALSSEGYSVDVALDNSLVSSYNSANGTSYAPMPASSVAIENSPVGIGRMKYTSASKVKVSFKNLSSLTDAGGYVVPLKVTSPAGVRQDKGVVYIVVIPENNMLVENPAIVNVNGIRISDRSAWTVEVDDVATTQVTDGDTSTYESPANPGIVEIAMDKEYHVGTLKLYNSSNVPTVGIEYSSDGSTYTFAGTADKNRYYVAGNNQYIVFSTPVKAKYFRFKLEYASDSNNRLYEVDVYETVGTLPLVYALDNVSLSGELFHTPLGIDAGTGGQFFAYLSTFSAKDVTVKVEQDNSLVAGYNTANGTTYKTIPAGNIEIANQSFVIPAGKTYNTQAPVSASLTGDLSSFTDYDNGYLVPLKLSSDNGSVSGRDVVYMFVSSDYSNMAPVVDQYAIFGTVATPTGWTATWNETAQDILVDNSTGSFVTLAGGAYANTIQIDMQQSRYVSGIRFYNRGNTYYATALKMEYSTDGTNWEYAGSATNSRSYINGNNQYFMFYTTLSARYLRITGTFSNNSRLYEVYVYESETSGPSVYVNSGTVINGGSIVHSPVGSESAVSASFNTYLSAYGLEEVTATVEQDNSFVAAYNTANGTNYKTIPNANVKVDNANQLIRAGLAQSLTPVAVSLTGDLSALNDYVNGYLIPLKVSSPSGVSTKNNVVYVAVTAKYSYIKSNPGAADVTGTQVLDRSGWGPTALANMFDGSTSSYVSASGFPQNSANLIDLGQNYNISSVRFYSYYATSSYYRPSTYYIQYSTDDVTYTDLGTATASEIYLDNGYQNIVIYGTIAARYLKVTPSGGNYYNWGGMAEFDIYTE